MAGAEPQIMAEGRFLRLIKEGHWEYAQRVKTQGAVALIAVTDDNRLVLTQQYRIPLHADTIELPAGLAGDEPGAEEEELAEAARRELLEETGYEAGHLRYLVTSPASAGMTDETVAFFHATGLKKVHAGGGVAHEAITVHEVPLGELHAWLSRHSRQGCAIDHKIFAALYLMNAERVG